MFKGRNGGKGERTEAIFRRSNRRKSHNVHRVMCSWWNGWWGKLTLLVCWRSRRRMNSSATRSRHALIPPSDRSATYSRREELMYQTPKDCWWFLDASDSDPWVTKCASSWFVCLWSQIIHVVGYRYLWLDSLLQVEVSVQAFISSYKQTGQGKVFSFSFFLFSLVGSCLSLKQCGRGWM